MQRKEGPFGLVHGLCGGGGMMECYAAIRIEGAKRLFQKEAWDQTLRDANFTDMDVCFQSKRILTEREYSESLYDMIVTKCPWCAELCGLR